MSAIEYKKRMRISYRKEECSSSTRPGGLARTRKIISTEKERELQFIRLCAQIRLEETKELRAENQRMDRRSKRKSV